MDLKVLAVAGFKGGAPDARFEEDRLLLLAPLIELLGLLLMFVVQPLDESLVILVGDLSVFVDPDVRLKAALGLVRRWQLFRVDLLHFLLNAVVVVKLIPLVVRPFDVLVFPLPPISVEINVP